MFDAIVDGNDVTNAKPDQVLQTASFYKYNQKMHLF
jgi:hypothetical protein